MRASLGWISLVILILWCGLIFGSSSTVILSRSFFAWIGTHFLTDEASFQRFRVFWGVRWFAIVKGWHFGAGLAAWLTHRWRQLPLEPPS